MKNELRNTFNNILKKDNYKQNSLFYSSNEEYNEEYKEEYHKIKSEESNSLYNSLE